MSGNPPHLPPFASRFYRGANRGHVRDDLPSARAPSTKSPLRSAPSAPPISTSVGWSATATHPSPSTRYFTWPWRTFPVWPAIPWKITASRRTPRSHPATRSSTLRVSISRRSWMITPPSGPSMSPFAAPCSRPIPGSSTASRPICGPRQSQRDGESDSAYGLRLRRQGHRRLPRRPAGRNPHQRGRHRQRPHPRTCHQQVDVLGLGRGA